MRDKILLSVQNLELIPPLYLEIWNPVDRGQTFPRRWYIIADYHCRCNDNLSMILLQIIRLSLQIADYHCRLNYHCICGKVWFEHPLWSFWKAKNMFPHLKIPKNFACGALQKASPVCILLFKFEKLWEKIVRVRIARTERISMVSGYSVGRRFPRSVPVPNHIALPGPCRFVFHIEVWSKGRQSHAGWVILESPFRGVCQNSIWNKSPKSNTSGASSFHELFLYLII